MAWMSLGIALLVGVAIGLTAVYLIRLRPASIAKDFAEELYRETETQRKAHIDSILAEMRANFGSLSVDAVTRSTREFVKFAEKMSQAEREARAKSSNATTLDYGQQVQQVAAQVERLTATLKDVERDRADRLRELGQQLKSLREQTAPSATAYAAADRRLGEATLRESEERFELLIQNAPVALAIHRTNDNLILTANPQFGTLFGLRSKTLVGHKFPDIYATPAD